MTTTENGNQVICLDYLEKEKKNTLYQDTFNNPDYVGVSQEKQTSIKSSHIKDIKHIRKGFFIKESADTKVLYIKYKH